MGFKGLRIALVGPLPPPAGGMANQTRQLAELLRGEGAVVELVQTNTAYRPVWVGQLPGLRALFRLLPYLWALWRAAGRNELLHVMANSGWSWHLFAAPAIWIANLRGRPVLINYRGGEAGKFLERSPGLIGASLRRVSALLVPSGFLEAVFAHHGYRAEVLPNVVDLRRFRPAETAAAPALHLLVARNLEPLYDNATAIRAFAAVRQQRPGLRMTVAGTGPDEPALRALAGELGLGEEALRFAGRVEREGMAELYRQSRLSLNPSLADNMPNSVLESLASGVPVVSTDVGGVPYLVQHGVTALLVPPRDVAAMRDAILRLLDDQLLHDTLRGNGLAEVQRYTWAQIGPLLAAFYRRSLQAPTASDLLVPRS
ncbi:glycosyltransferase family 4 protein [Roseateles sp. DAIF2]|nr:glycosyltransferase family 4 protein [Roseateles sp. DAIF2]